MNNMYEVKTSPDKTCPRDVIEADNFEISEDGSLLFFRGLQDVAIYKANAWESVLRLQDVERELKKEPESSSLKLSQIAAMLEPVSTVRFTHGFYKTFLEYWSDIELDGIRKDSPLLSCSISNDAFVLVERASKRLLAREG